MTYSGFRVKVPGKLLMAGEYAVLEPNQKAIVMAVDRYVTAYVEPCRQNQLSLPQLGLENVAWDQNTHFNVADLRLNFVQNAIRIVKQYLSENSISLRPFHLLIKSELDSPENGKKYGLGSSAAVVTAVVSSILIMYEDKLGALTLDTVFKLAALAHLKTQKGGSGVDIAASVYGGVLVYSSFKQDWVLNELKKGTSLSELLRKPWPNLSVRTISAPANLTLCVGWTKEPASTSILIKKAKDYKSSHPLEYHQFLRKSSFAVSHLVLGLDQKNDPLILSSLRENREVLLRFAKKAGITIETPKLKDLCTIANQFGSGKSSGAGGGDCGIALIKNKESVEKMKKAWIANDIQPLNLAVSKTGASVMEYNCEPSLEEYFVR